MISKKTFCMVLIGLFAMCIMFSGCSKSDIIVYANLSQEEQLYCTFTSSNVNYNLVAFVYNSNGEEVKVNTASQAGNGIIMTFDQKLPTGKYKIVIKGDPGDYKFEDGSDERYEIISKGVDMKAGTGDLGGIVG